MANLGFTFNGLHSYRNFGIITKSSNRPLLPEIKEAVEDIPGRDGEYDYSAVNADKRQVFKDRLITLECTFKEPLKNELFMRVRQIAAWLVGGEAALIFDDDNTVYYLAMVKGGIDFERMLKTCGKFNIVFKCKPFAFSTVQSQSTFFLSQDNNAVHIHNSGSWPVKPLITLSGTASQLHIICGDKELVINDALNNNYLEIDCENMKVIKDFTVNKLNVISGSFIEFDCGENVVNITGTNLNLTVDFTFMYKYI